MGHGHGHDHDQDHDHGHDHQHVPADIRHERPLWIALGLTAGFLLVELFVAWLANSLALLSDAAHMATDTLALGIALVAVRLARRPPDAHRSYGYGRMEALGALCNGVLLLAVAAWILVEAFERFRSPPPVATGAMMLVAALGLAVNLLAMRLLHAAAGESLNLRGAYLEVWADMIGSIAVLVAGALIRWTGWYWIDAATAVAVGLWVLPRTLRLAGAAVHLLLEGVPRGLSLDEVRAALLAVDGVAGVHDLHVWSLTSTRPLLSAHVAVAAGRDADALCRDLGALLRERFGIAHTTLQMETAACQGHGCDPP
ncbi:cation diffusion facilitator family transporter [Arenimonas composti]|uniref:Cation transporter n=1 Tax=Arenimonas composti TR7-09 = DSM 18010 TaxID=1121013 RepID=A0A091B8Y1_9GAMM|nr:cation diffusion facilitator family transporter [Arenimonas composti]KFN49108.1 hypothetical protein P873_12510 [Arenimonas composti TR7-09 = DSM 18010]